MTCQKIHTTEKEKYLTTYFYIQNENNECKDIFNFGEC